MFRAKSGIRFPRETEADPMSSTYSGIETSAAVDDESITVHDTNVPFWAHE
jgi:hypothetical protein